jgi:outer membrane lipoprotein-sorting protein
MVRKTLVALGLALVAAQGSAQTLDEILAGHYKALGGLDKVKAVKSMRLTGEMTVGPGILAPFTLEMKRPNRMRIDITIQGMTGTQAYDGETAWMQMPFMGKKDPEPMPAEEAKDAAEQADMDGVLVDSAAKGHKVELVGKESVDGADAWKLKVTTKGGDVVTIYLEADSLLQIRSERKRTIRGSEMEFEQSIGDYKAVDGLMLPHSFESGPKGAPTRQKMTVTKVEMNPAIDDAKFKMPAPAAKP